MDTTFRFRWSSAPGLGLRLLIGIGLAVSVLSAATPVAAQSWWLFETRRVFDPLIAEVRAAQTSVLFPARSDPFEFSPVEDPFLAWDISLGAEIPLIGWESQTTRLADLTRGEGGLGLWLPIGFHMIEDVQHDEYSRPIINTDYRFALLAKGMFKPWSATAIEARVSIGHESTHIGDEFTLHALEHAPAEFRRVNVSYESLDYGIGLQLLRTLPFLEESEILLRHTGIYPINPGYYSPELLEGPAGTVTASKRKYEPGIGVQLLSERAWRPGLSVDLRRRIVYGYDRVTAEEPEATQWSWNVIIATRTRDLDFAGKVHFLLYGRFYDGVNPAGQFRNDDAYRIWGVGILTRIGAR